jgi:hypothetical protein
MGSGWHARLDLCSGDQCLDPAAAALGWTCSYGCRSRSLWRRAHEWGGRGQEEVGRRCGDGDGDETGGGRGGGEETATAAIAGDRQYCTAPCSPSIDRRRQCDCSRQRSLMNSSWSPLSRACEGARSARCLRLGVVAALIAGGIDANGMAVGRLRTRVWVTCVGGGVWGSGEFEA